MYADMDDEAQVAVLRAVALDACAQFGLDVAALDLVVHMFNTTFRVETCDGQRFALRVNTNSLSTAANVTAQQAWIHALARDTEVALPDAVATPGGRPFALVPCAEMGRDVIVVLNRWLDGDPLDGLDADAARRLGEIMATLHAHAEHWQLPPGAKLPLFDDPLFGDPDMLSSVTVDEAGRAVIDEALWATRRAFARLYDGARPIVLHADLHAGNMLRQGTDIAVFDFDDAGRGVPALDLGIATFYLDRGAEESDVEAALRSGYTARRAWPEVAPEDFEAVLAARQLLLANSLLTSTTAALQADAAAYLDVTIERLRRWLDTRRFTRG